MSDQQILEKDIGKPLSSSIKSLLLRNTKGLKSLDLIAECDQLEGITFRTSGKIPELGPLARCSNLKRLSFEGKTQVPGFDSLEGMSQLEKMTICGRMYEQCKGVRLPVNELWVHSTTIDQLSYFSECESLRELELGSDTGIYTKIDDETDFKPVQQIEQLFLMSRAMTTTKKMSALKNCRSLCVGANKRLKVLAGLDQLSKLEALAVDSSAVKDLGLVNRLPLKYLSAGKTRVSTIKDLDLPELIQLYLPNSRIKAFPEIESLGNLELLSLSNTPVKSIAGVTATNSLKYISLQECQDLTDYSPLFDHPTVEAIDLTESLVDWPNFERLLRLPNLKQVSVCKTKITEDAAHLSDAQKLATEHDVQLICEKSDLHGFQYPYYRLMVFYLHAYLGDQNPWHENWPTGYHV